MLALMLAGGLAFAQDVTISGTTDHAWQFGDAAYQYGTGEADVKVTAVVDDINTAVIQLEDEENAAGGEDFVEVDNAYLDTNLGAAFGLGDTASVMTRVGLFEHSEAISAVTAAEFEDVAAVSEEVPQIQMTVGVMNMVNLKGIIIPGDGTAMDGYIGIDGGYGPVTAELFLTDVGGRELADGSVGFGVQYAANVVPDTLDIDAVAEVHALLSDEVGAFTDPESQVRYGFGVAATALDIATLGVSFRGETEVPADALGIDLNVEPVAFAGLDLLAVVALDSDYYAEESFQYFEGSVYLKPGAATFRVGYAYYPDVYTEAANLALGDDAATPLGSDENSGGFLFAEGGYAFFRASLDY
jgi:hypothetical protein